MPLSVLKRKCGFSWRSRACSLASARCFSSSSVLPPCVHGICGNSRWHGSPRRSTPYMSRSNGKVLSNGRTTSEKATGSSSTQLCGLAKEGAQPDVGAGNPKAAARWIPAVRHAAPASGGKPPRKRAIGTESSPTHTSRPVSR